MTKGQKTAKRNKELYGEDYYSRLGEKGGAVEGSGKKAKATMLARYGENYYKEIRARRK